MGTSTDRASTRRETQGAAFCEGFVCRPALVRRLLDRREAPLALIAAPAGYGKSTLLAEWAARDERPFIWVTLSSRGQDAMMAATSIMEEFGEMAWIAPDAGPAPPACLTGDATGALRALMHSLDQAQRRFVLVLDDAHTIRPAVLRAVVAALLERLGRGSQIAVATRTEPPLPIGRLRARRELVEVRTEDLKMSPAEAATLLRLAGLESDFATVRTLLAQTEGWPTGLYLAALALGSEVETDAAMASLQADDHLIADYVSDELLVDLAPEMRRFVTRTSVLDHLSGPLCDAVLDQLGSAATLAGLARCHLMLIPIDRKREQFRWHGLFQAALRAELRRTEPELELELHRRASTWLAEHGDLDAAIAHAVVAGDVTRAGGLLWANVADYLFDGHIDTIQTWLARFTADQIAQSPALALACAHTRLIAGHIAQARHWGLLAVEAERRPGQTTATPSLETGTAIIDAVAAEAGPAQMAQDAMRAYQLEPDHSQWRPISCLLTGVAEHLAGHHHSAEQWLHDGVALSAAAAPAIGSLCLAQLTMIAIEADDWTRAGELAERAARIIEEHPSLGTVPISALVFAASATTRAHEGRVDEAKRDLRRGVDLLAALGDFASWYDAETRILLARAAIGLADSVRARTLLAEASRLARRTPDARIFVRHFDDAWGQIDTLAETTLSGPSSLTIAELRILRFLPSHRSLREIAERLDVSVNTVKTQAHAIYRKLDAASRSEAVERASQAGLLGH
jgi:LuxR family maltose regulon positive regulatory protein